MSPYVVTTKRRVEHRAPAGKIGLLVTQAVSRRAVATLDDAAQVVFDLVEGRYPLSDLSEAIALEIKRTPATTSYTLPDGTVIEVERVEWQTLIAQADFVTLPSPVDSASNATEIIAAFNAQEANR